MDSSLLKALDGWIAGIPINAVQRIEIGKLKEQIAALERENESLRARVEELAPKCDMPVDAAKILKFYFETDKSYTAEYIAQKFELKPGVAKHLADFLRTKRFLDFTSIVIVNNAPRAYRITEEGRAYIIEHGMA